MFDQALGFAFSAALLWLVIGTFFRIGVWLRSRSDLSIVLTPAPASSAGVIGRLLLELFVFRALWRASPITWIASLGLHYGLLFVLLMHLRFFYEHLPLWLVPLLGVSGWAALAFIAGVLILLLRRIVVDRVRYVSSPSDYLHLLLLLAIALSGALLKRVWPTELHAVGEFFRGVFYFSWQTLPEHTALIVHLVLVLVLLFVIPISKLLHGVGIVFSPTLVQRDRVGKSE